MRRRSRHIRSSLPASSPASEINRPDNLAQKQQHVPGVDHPVGPGDAVYQRRHVSMGERLRARLLQPERDPERLRRVPDIDEPVAVQIPQNNRDPDDVSKQKCGADTPGLAMTRQ